MTPLNTFYDTLQVSRSATESVIRAAYKTLCQKYHPDKNPNDVEGATQDMLLLNKAYEVLSDSQQRLAYDLWITQRERDRRVQAEKKAAEAAAAAASMFPPIEMPPAPPAPTVQPRPVPTPSRSAPAHGPLDFAPTTLEDPAGQPEFADTQPQLPGLPDSVSPSAPRVPTGVSAALQSCAVREPPRTSAPAQAVDWLRERPLWLITVVLAGVLVIAFAPWLRTVSLGGAQPVAPITPDLQPTYVEPATEPSAAPVALPATDQQEPSAPVTASPARTTKSAHAAASKRTAAAPKKPQESGAPAAPPEPVPVAPPLDAGGHSGFAPKCRWVTPTRWSCD